MNSSITIAEARRKCKDFVARIPRDVAILTILVLASSASFGLGYLAGKDVGQGSTVALETESLSVSPATTTISGQVVASKNGTKYYLPSCAGADRISDVNKVWFASPVAAENAGYTLAANCKGI